MKIEINLPEEITKKDFKESLIVATTLAEEHLKEMSELNNPTLNKAVSLFVKRNDLIKSIIPQFKE